MKKILQVLHSLAGGGVENLLYSYLTHMDRTGLQFDFIVYGTQPGAIEPWFTEMGCNIMRVPFRHDGMKKHSDAVEKIIAAGGYDVVHSHQGHLGFVTLRLAKKYGVKTRILHSHIAYPPESASAKAIRVVGAALGKHYATDLFACGRDAGTWLYGKSAMENGRVHIMPNAIDLDRFTFDENVRKRLRDELNLNGRYVIGCVARFTEQKNHALLLDIFKCVREKRPDALLLLAGEGDLMEDTRRKASALGISDDVRFLGVRTDVPELLQAMDAFVLPSRYEGLGIVFLEAQAAGLPTFGPNIPGARDTVVSSLMTAIQLDSAPEKWVDAIIGRSADNARTGARSELAAAGYDINEQSRLLERFYRGENQ